MFFPLSGLWRLLKPTKFKKYFKVAYVLVRTLVWATVFVFTVIEPFNTLVLNMALVPLCNIIPVITSWYQYYCINPTEPVMGLGSLSEKKKTAAAAAAQ